MFSLYEWSELSETALHNAIEYHSTKFNKVIAANRASMRKQFDQYFDQDDSESVPAYISTITTEYSAKRYAMCSHYSPSERYTEGMISISCHNLNRHVIASYLAKYQARAILRERSVLVLSDRRTEGFYNAYFRRDLENKIREYHGINPMSMVGITINFSTRSITESSQYNNLRSSISNRDIRLIIIDSCDLHPTTLNTSDDDPILRLAELFSRMPNALIVTINQLDDFKMYYPSTIESMIEKSFFPNSSSNKDDLWANDIEEEEYGENY